MNQDNQEQYIANHFASLPRKSVFSDGRETVWLKVHNFILEEKLTQARTETRVSNRARYYWRVFSQVAAATLVLILALTLVTKAADAKPGETLYPVKQVAEQVESALATSDQAKVEVKVKHAKRRLAEVQQLVEENKGPKIVAQTLKALKNTTAEVVAVTVTKPELLDHAVELTREEAKVLATVENSTAGEIKQAVQSAISETKQSITQLQISQDEKDAKETVKGTTVTEDHGSATTTQAIPLTNATNLRRIKVGKETVKDAPLQSEIQIGGVVKIEDINHNGIPEPLPLNK